jgi:hypothetical protein
MSILVAVNVAAFTSIIDLDLVESPPRTVLAFYADDGT